MVPRAIWKFQIALEIMLPPIQSITNVKKFGRPTVTRDDLVHKIVRHTFCRLSTLNINLRQYFVHVNCYLN